MKTIAKRAGWIDWMILGLMITLGIILGNLTGESRIGLMTGISAGLTGIAGFRFLLEKKTTISSPGLTVDLSGQKESRKAA